MRGVDDLQLDELGVRNLPRVFEPRGLTLPLRSPHGNPTTSVLVRGQAGVGKTTLALSVGRAIASGVSGSLYYLSTEISPPDLRFKLKQLGVPTSECRAFTSAGGGSETILYEHLLNANPDAAESIHGRGALAFEHIASLIDDERFSRVKVVVVDAFGLSGDAASTTELTSLRASLHQLIVGFEEKGISVVLVEEAPAPSSDWVSFVVDVMFELRWERDEDTGALLRKLLVPKSRFSRASPGPHDYGLVGNRPAVWPDWSLLKAVETRNPERFLLCDEKQCKVGGLISSPVDGDNRPAFAAKNAQWLKGVNVRLGQLARIEGPAGTAEVWLHEGPAAVLWAIEHASGGPVDFISVTGLAAVHGRRRWTPSFLDMLSAKSEDCAVILEGSKALLDSLNVEFDWTPRIRIGIAWSPLPPITGAGATHHLREHLATAFPQASEEQLRWSKGLSSERWALLQAYLFGDPRALRWLESAAEAGIRKDPLFPAALARIGRLDEALAIIAETAVGAEVHFRSVELHLATMSKTGLDCARAAIKGLKGAGDIDLKRLKNLETAADEIARHLGA
ncbi:MAG: hypothetical protein IV100_30430 [Myxococcales bacterium]|nr:hypothetical protein [Myxococcales bacterium]